MQAKVGCCGFPMARAEYYRRFPVVEIQQTFYDLPRIQTAERWRREALIRRSRNGRADFEFTMKAWQLITHEPSSPTYRRLRKVIPEEEKGLYGSFQAVAEQCAGEEPTYVLFNNLFMGEDALRLQKLLARPALRLVRTARQRRA
jgi:uncharacterized protein YecE (DUF72 family)